MHHSVQEPSDISGYNVSQMNWTYRNDVFCHMIASKSWTLIRWWLVAKHLLLSTTLLDGGHLLVMLNNAQWISEKQVFGAFHLGENGRKLKFPNSKERWLHKTEHDAFATIVGKRLRRPTKR